MKKQSETFRLLIIEDDNRRIKTFREWIPNQIPIVVAESAGKAMGLLIRDNNRKNGRVYAGILLDRDLHEQALTHTDLSLSGNDLIDIIINNIERDVPVLMHSTNIHQSERMKKQLEGNGFCVTKTPMYDLTREKFDEWFEDAYSYWQDLQEEGS